MSPWLRIDGWLEQNAPEVLAQLSPPASADSVAKLERALERKLPADVREAFLAHDGALEDATTIFGAIRTPKEARYARLMCWLSIERVAEQLAFLRDLGEFPEELLPIGEDAGGNLLVVNLDTGAISAWDHEDWSTTTIAKDMNALATNLADDMDANLVTVDEEDEDFPALVLLDKPPPKLAVPQITEDRPARVLVAVMLERRMIALTKGRDIEKLIVELTAALALNDAIKRRERVVEVLEENPAVDELFADDETIDALLEELG